MKDLTFACSSQTEQKLWFQRLSAIQQVTKTDPNDDDERFILHYTPGRCLVYQDYLTQVYFSKTLLSTLWQCSGWLIKKSQKNALNNREFKIDFRSETILINNELGEPTQYNFHQIQGV